MEHSHQWASSHTQGQGRDSLGQGWGEAEVTGIHKSLGLLLKCSDGLGLRVCISNKLSGHPNIAVPSHTFCSKDLKHGTALSEQSNEQQAHVGLPLVQRHPAPPNHTLGFHHLEGKTTWIF